MQAHGKAEQDTSNESRGGWEPASKSEPLWPCHLGKWGCSVLKV